MKRIAALLLGFLTFAPAVTAGVEAVSAAAPELAPQQTNFSAPGLSSNNVQDRCADDMPTTRVREVNGVQQVLYPDPDIQQLTDAYDLTPGIEGDLLNEFHAFNMGLNPTNLNNLETALRAAITNNSVIYCDDSYGTYINASDWNFEYYNNTETYFVNGQQATTNEFFCGQPGANYSNCDTRAEFTGLTANPADSDYIFVEQRASQHINKFMLVWPFSISGQVTSTDSNAMPIMPDGNWIEREQICWYSFEGACPHDFLSDPGIGTCDASLGSYRWQGCTVEYNSQNSTAAAICPSYIPTMLQQSNKYDIYNNLAKQWGYPDLSEPRNGCTIARSAASAPTHADVFEYRQLKWYSCEDVPTRYQADELFLQTCDSDLGQVINLNTWCRDFGSARANVSASTPRASTGTYTVGSTQTPASLANGVWANNTASRQNIVMPDANGVPVGTIAGLRIDGSVSLNGGSSLSSSTFVPDCTGTPTINVLECRGDVALVNYRASTASDTGVRYQFGLGSDADRFGSGTITRWDATASATEEVPVGVRVIAQAGTTVEQFIIGQSSCEPDVTLKCAYAAVAGTFEWEAEFTGADFGPVIVDVALSQNRAAGPATIAPQGTWSATGTAADGQMLQARYANTGVVIAAVRIGLENCTQNADVHLVCVDQNTFIARIDNMTASDGDMVYFRLFIGADLEAEGTVNNSTELDEITVPNGTLVRLNAYGRGDMPSGTAPSQFTEVIASRQMVIPCGLVEAEATDRVCPTNQTHLAFTSLDRSTTFTVMLDLVTGSTATETVEVSFGETETYVRDLFPAVNYEDVVTVTVRWNQDGFAMATVESVRHDANPDCGPVPCDDDQDGMPDVTCGDGNGDTAIDVLADIIHDSWEYTSVRDVTADPNVAHTRCRPDWQSTFGETCDVRLTGEFAGWTARFATARIDQVGIDLSQQIEAVEQNPAQTSGIEIDFCDGTDNGANHNPLQRVAACEVHILKRADTETRMSESTAIEGTFSHWAFTNGTLSPEIMVDGAPATAGYCWAVGADITVSLWKNGQWVTTSHVDAGVLHNEHPEIGMPYGPFWQPSNAAPHSPGCFAVWLPTPTSP